VAERGKERGAAARVAGKVVERGKERAATESTEDIAITTNRRTLRIQPPAQLERSNKMSSLLIYM
jgi:hypothetical protein